MTQPIFKLALAVLCGGASRRMGTPKASLEIDGESMLVRTLRRLSAVCGGPQFVVAAADQVLPPLFNDAIVLRDRTPGRGPVEGLALALQAAGNRSEIEAVAVVGCDLPWLEPELLRALFTAMRDDADVIAVQDADRLHPLAAIYRPCVARMAEARLEARKLSLHELLGGAKTQTVDLDFVRSVDPSLRSLLNVNTQEDWRRATM